LLISTDALEKFKEKDQKYVEDLAKAGFVSSDEIQRPLSLSQKFSRLVIRWGNYILERGEEDRHEDKRIQQKSYAGFYFFLKWFIRSVFFSTFAILGSVAGKEIGCGIKDHSTCNDTAIDLANNSPHLIATFSGTVGGLIVGQWFGRIIWDRFTTNILRCLRWLEKRADQSKIYLVNLSLLVYFFGIVAFVVIFYFFVDMGNDSVMGGILGGSIGLFCALIAYRKKKFCRSGQETPRILSRTPIESLPDLKLEI
jgi:hypothetical protein